MWNNTLETSDFPPRRFGVDRNRAVWIVFVSAKAVKALSMASFHTCQWFGVREEVAQYNFLPDPVPEMQLDIVWI